MDDLHLARKYIAKSDNAKSRGIKFSMSFTAFKNVMRAKYCHYTGIELNDTPGSPHQRTIDRINYTKGYENGNVVACCMAFNNFKSGIERDGLILNPNMRRAIDKMFRMVDKSVGNTKRPKRKSK